LVIKPFVLWRSRWRRRHGLLKLVRWLRRCYNQGEQKNSLPSKLLVVLKWPTHANAPLPWKRFDCSCLFWYFSLNTFLFNRFFSLIHPWDWQLTRCLNATAKNTLTRCLCADIAALDLRLARLRIFIKLAIHFHSDFEGICEYIAVHAPGLSLLSAWKWKNRRPYK